MAIKVPQYQIQRRPRKELGISPVLGGPRALGVPKTLAPPLMEMRVGRAEVELWRTVGEVGKEILEYQRQLRQAELASELSTAKADLFIELSTFEDTLTDRSDPKNYLEDYKNLIQTRKASFDKSLSPEVKNVFNDYFRREAQKGALRVKEEAGTQIRENLRGKLNKVLDVHSRGLASKDPSRRVDAFGLYQQAVKMARETKAITPEIAEMYLAKGKQLYHRGNAWDVVKWIGYEDGIKWLKGELKFEKAQGILDALDEDTKEGLIRRFTAENKIITAKVKQARDLEIKVAQNAVLKRMETFPQMATEDVIAFRNEILVSRNLPPVGTGSKDFFLKMIDAKVKALETGEKDPYEVTDMALYGKIRSQINVDPDTIKSSEEIDKHRGKGLSNRHADSLVDKWNSTKTGAIKPKDPLKEARSKRYHSMLKGLETDNIFDGDPAKNSVIYGQRANQLDNYLKANPDATDKEVEEHFSKLIELDKEGWIMRLWDRWSEAVTFISTEPTREKGQGFLGTLKRPDGMVSTELSIGVNIDGKEIEIPSLVPTLTKEEITYLLKGNKPTQKIVDKAVKHAKKRITEGKSPFAQKGEQRTKVGTREVAKTAPTMEKSYHIIKEGEPTERTKVSAEPIIEESPRQRAIDILNAKKQPLTEKNITFIMDRLED